MIVVGVVLVAAVVAVILVHVTSGTSGPTSSGNHATGTARFTTPGALEKARATADDAVKNNHCPKNPQTRVNQLHWSSPPPMTIDPSAKYTAAVTTTAGAFIITLDAQAAPETVNNFVFLAEQGYYHCNTFDLIVPGSIVQTGDPTGTGHGGPGYVLPPENVPNQYATGDVAMADTGGGTSGSQFFVVTGGSSKLSPKYSLFGTVTSGIGIPQQINLQGSADPNGGGTSSLVVERVMNVKIKEH